MQIDAGALLVTLILGNWAFTAGAYAFAYRLYHKFLDNHLKHLEERIKQLEAQTN